MKSIEVILSPALFKYKTTIDNYIVVVVDVLRATTAFCAAFDSGAKTVIPVLGLDELLEYKNKGFLVAAERNGKKVDFADFGNSPSVFSESNLTGNDLAYSTTNGTQAIEIAKKSGKICAAAFVNLDAASEWLFSQHTNIIVLCSGWKNTVSLEDTLCAGALVELLELSGLYTRICDSSTAALALWQSSKNELEEVVKKANHYQRLVKLSQQKDLEHSLNLNSSNVVPVWNGKEFLNYNA